MSRLRNQDLRLHGTLIFIGVGASLDYDKNINPVTTGNFGNCMTDLRRLLERVARGVVSVHCGMRCSDYKGTPVDTKATVLAELDSPSHLKTLEDRLSRGGDAAAIAYIGGHGTVNEGKHMLALNWTKGADGFLGIDQIDGRSLLETGVFRSLKEQKVPLALVYGSCHSGQLCDELDVLGKEAFLIPSANPDGISGGDWSYRVTDTIATQMLLGCEVNFEEVFKQQAKFCPQYAVDIRRCGLPWQLQLSYEPHKVIRHLISRLGVVTNLSEEEAILDALDVGSGFEKVMARINRLDPFLAEGLALPQCFKVGGSFLTDQGLDYLLEYIG